jgi:hypothetical protein
LCFTIAARMTAVEFTGGPNQLPASEREDFERIDAEIRRIAGDGGLRLGPLLRDVRGRNLWRESFESWAAYCEQRRGQGGRHGNRLIAYAALRDDWDPGLPLPPTERHARRSSRRPPNSGATP